MRVPQSTKRKSKFECPSGRRSGRVMHVLWSFDSECRSPFAWNLAFSNFQIAYVAVILPTPLKHRLGTTGAGFHVRSVGLRSTSGF
jgi:hypothetical protein